MSTTNDNLRNARKRSDSKNPNIQKMIDKGFYRGNAIIPSVLKYKDVKPEDIKAKRDSTAIDYMAGQIDFTKSYKANMDFLGNKPAIGNVAPPELEPTFDKAISFNGVDQYASLASTINSSTVTISAWVNTNEASNCRFLGLSSGITNWIDYRTSSNAINLRNGVGGVNFNFPSVNTGVWAHVYVSGNAGTSRVFLNGVESTSGAQAVAGNFNFDDIARVGGISFFQAIVDELVIHNAVAANPAAEAAALYNGGAYVDPLSIIPSAQQHYSFNSNSNNLGALGGSATLFNSPTYVDHL